MIPAEQLGLFEPHPPKVGRNHPDTSVMAAADVMPRTGTQRRAVYEYLRGEPRGATDAEIQAALGMEGNTERPRRIELVESGLVRDSGRRRGPGGSRLGIVWVLT